MLPTTENKIRDLIECAILIEDPQTGVIHLDPLGYTLLQKPIPQSFNQAAFKARVEKLVKDYLAVWPPKVMSGNRLVRQGPGAIRKKLTVFLKKFPKFTDDQIITATKKYVDKLRQSNYNYMVCSDYFLEKNGVSQLESYIVALQQQTESAVKTPSTIFERTV